MTIEYTDGTTRQIDSLDEGRDILAAQYPDLVEAEQWDASGPGKERLLFWEDEDSAENDAGAKACAEIVREMVPCPFSSCSWIGPEDEISTHAEQHE